ncbi:MAG: cyclic nucleotide-binding domain-containing protein [Bdellovibrionales bacterium]|nr:cyclic nucleotide-binding domain-containing protein [Bdellovibrionales bacterium]
MKIASNAYSDVGRSRENNEDFLVNRPDLGLFIICDGMGGHAAGETASRKAAEVLINAIEEDLDLISIKNPAETKIYLNEKINIACKEIFRLANTVQNYSGMGTTLTMLLCQGRKAYVAHVGDSRLYLFRSGKLSLLTSDHTLLALMKQKGGVQLLDPKNSPYAHVLTRCLGKEELVLVDTLSLDLLPNDSFLLCSDGLSSAFNNDLDIETKIAELGTEAVEKLVLHAKELDGGDNISAITVEVISEDKQKVFADEIKLQFQILKQIYLFKDLSTQEAMQVLEVVAVQDFKAGDVIITEGEKGDFFYMILEGELEISRNGKEIATLGYGNHIGEISFLANESRTATVRSRTNSRLMGIRSTDFRDLINRDKNLGNKLLWNLAQEIGSKLSKSNGV